MKQSFIVVTSLLSLVSIVMSCASIVGHPDQLMPITSTPGEATVSVWDESGAEIFKGTTPTQVTLQKSTGKYWGKKSYRVIISKEGYKDTVIPVVASHDGWYLLGNMAFGGLIGWFLFDPFNGNIYSFNIDKVSATLVKEVIKNGSKLDDAILIITSTTEVPQEFLTEMKQIEQLKDNDERP